MLIQPCSLPQIWVHVFILPPTLMEHLLYTWQGARHRGYEDEKEAVMPMESSQSRVGESERAAIHSHRFYPFIYSLGKYLATLPDSPK